MDLEQIRQLLRIVAESGIEEVEIKEGDFKIVTRRSASQAPVAAPPPVMPSPYGYSFPPPMAAPAYPQHIPAGAMPVAPAPVVAAAQPPIAPAAPVPAAPAPDPEPEPEPDNEELVRAPIVGTYYAAPSPEADPFVKVGTKVNVGDVLCIIEAMKLMNEIEAEVSGTITEILVENGTPVEYDSPLFKIVTG